MEPIRKVTSRRLGLDPTAGVLALPRAERRQPGEERDDEQRAPERPPAPVVRRDDDGRGRVDVRA